MELQFASDVQKRVNKIIKSLDLPHIDYKRVICFRSFKSKSRARARIWSFPRIWQMALNLKSHYVIEVLSENFDGLDYDNQTKVLIHEIMHIPKTFSGALLPHRGRGKVKIDSVSVELLFKQFKSKIK
jgi:predicted metallopeptidase